jgi:hypothetical protein
MIRDAYYSQRNGLNKMDKSINLDQLKELFRTIYNKFDNEEYFRDKIGYFDGNNYQDGDLGNKYAIQSLLFLKLRKNSLWPIWSYLDKYSEDDLFDIIEFCFDNISKPIYDTTGYIIKYNNEEGQKEYREEINKQLKDYNDGYELDNDGNIVRLLENGVIQLVKKEPPTEDEDIKQKIEQAIRNYRKRNSTLLDRKESVRHLADILEKLRPKIKKIITKKDEDDLFNIVNNFGIRHHNDNQKTDYDGNIWTSWMFHYYLATIHACLLLLKKE